MKTQHFRISQRLLGDLHPLRIISTALVTARMPFAELIASGPLPDRLGSMADEADTSAGSSGIEAADAVRNVLLSMVFMATSVPTGGATVSSS